MYKEKVRSDKRTDICIECTTEKPIGTKVSPYGEFAVFGHMTESAISNEVSSDSSQMRVRPRFARKEIPDLTFTQQASPGHYNKQTTNGCIIEYRPITTWPKYRPG